MLLLFVVIPLWVSPVSSAHPSKALYIPLSNFEIVNDRIIQCFQRACFEWHPNFPSADAFVAKAVTTQSDWQTLYVIVRDQNLRTIQMPNFIVNIGY